MDKLTPQNEEQKYMIQILLAKMQGVEVEISFDNKWLSSECNSITLSGKYRIKPHELPITKEMWAMINNELKWVAKDKNGSTWFYRNKPIIDETKGYWDSGWQMFCKNIFNINSDNIDWRQSLTERPKGV